MATIPKLTDRAIVLKPEDDVAVAKASLEMHTHNLDIG